MLSNRNINSLGAQGGYFRIIDNHPIFTSLLPQSVLAILAMIDFEDQQADSVLTSAYGSTVGVRFNGVTVRDYSSQRPGFTPSVLRGSNLVQLTTNFAQNNSL
jgi:hypothetical protein